MLNYQEAMYSLTPLILYNDPYSPPSQTVVKLEELIMKIKLLLLIMIMVLSVVSQFSAEHMQ